MMNKSSLGQDLTEVKKDKTLMLRERKANCQFRKRKKIIF